MPKSPNFERWDDWWHVPKTITEKDIEILQRYGMKEIFWNKCICWMQNGEYVLWDELIQLLK